MPTPDRENPPEGLQAPHGILETLEPPRRRSLTRRILQVVGFTLGVALLAWVVSIALSAENRATFDRLLDAPPQLAIALFALTLAAIIINGVVFHVVLLPIRRLPLLEIIAVNALSTFLSILPFKISVITRVVIHHRRDGLPLRDIIAWFATVSAGALAILAPLFLVSIWRAQLDALWIAGAILGTLAATAAALPLAHLAQGPLPILHRLSLGADRIVSNPKVLFSQYALRLLDIATVAARFWVVARIVGLDLPPDRAVLLGSTYFLIAVISPVSALGFSEMGAVIVARLSGLDAPAVAVVALAVTLANVATAGVLSIPTFAWLRPDRIIAPKRPAQGA